MSASSGPGEPDSPSDPESAQAHPAPGREGMRARSDVTSRSYLVLRRSIGSPRLLAIIYTSLASAIYFSLGVIAGHALGLTPLVFLIAAMVFALTALTYVEGASLHQDRGGATVFARYAFNELVSFIAGWAVLLDYMILVAVTAYSATQYLRVFWNPLGGHDEALPLSFAVIAFVVFANIRGFGWRRARRIGALVVADLALQLFIVVLGLALFFDPHTLLRADPSRDLADLGQLHLRADDHGGRVHEPGVRRRSRRRGARQPRWAEADGGGRHDHRDRGLCRHRAGRHHRAAGPRRPHRAGGPLPERSDDRSRRRSAPAVAGGSSDVCGRGARQRHADRRRQLGDARPVAPGLLAVNQPPDPERPRPPAPCSARRPSC